MPVALSVENDNYIVVTLRDQFEFAEYQQALKDSSEFMQQKGKVKVLVLLDNFAGWQASEGWGDISAWGKYDQYIEKMAIIADPKWSDQIAAFTGKGLRPFQIEFFPSTQEAAARA